MAKNANADNDYWEEYKKLGKGFKGTYEEFEDLVVEEEHPRAIRKKRADGTKFTTFFGDYLHGLWITWDTYDAGSG